MVDIPIACSSSTGASSTGGILLMGCLSLLGWCYLSAVPLGCLSAAAFLWGLRCVAASHRRFGRREPTAKSFCALITSGPAPAAAARPTGAEKQRLQAWGGLGSAPRSPRGGICSQPSAKGCRRAPASTPAQHGPRGAVGRTRVPRGSHKTRPKRFGQPRLFERRYYS